MENKYDIIKAPIVTEKNMAMAENGTYVFEVKKETNKTAVKQAIEEIFKVKVEKVNIINAKPRRKKVGKYAGKTAHRKKALIKLKEGYTIDFSS